jgi:hypothetical protein
MPDDLSRSVRPGDPHLLHESRLTHQPREVLARLRALVTHDLGPDARADVEREIRSWEYHVAAFERQPT